MDSHALQVLEFQQLLDVVAGYAETEPGRDIVRRLKPQTDLGGICSRHGLYRDLLRLLAEGVAIPAVQVADLSEALRRVSPEGAVIGSEDLLLCRQLLDSASAVIAFVGRECCQEAEALTRLGKRLDACPEVRDALRRALDDNGEILDSASDRLATLRRQVRSIESGIHDRLEKMLQSSTMESLIQERFVTLRNGRLVIPVKREMKGRVSGIVHDHSDSGRTVFVEPATTVPLGNELCDLRLEERDEIHRILAALSGLVRDRGQEMKHNLRALAELDAATGIARWGHEYECVIPTFGRKLSLLAARHPLLEKQFREQRRRGALVPLDISVPPRAHVLAITGSNSGGKTVALKTIGLITLAAQSGLPVPVDEKSELEVFKLVFADIGDEQSISENLSTFTGHLTQINRMLSGVVGGRSLVLLDELGSGTDPLEGGALACAIIQDLVKADAFTALTTHLGVVKTVVHEHRNMVNACVRFNARTLRPEYALDIGKPGASHAFSIAQRIGLPESIIRRAQGMLSSDHLHLENMLAQLEEDQRLVAQHERATQAALKDLVRDRDEVRDELDKLRNERRRLMHDAYQQASATVDNTRKQMERLLQQLQQSERESGRIAEAKRIREAIAERDRKLAHAIDQTAPKPPEPVPPETLVVGQEVWVEKLQANGRIVDISDECKKITVEVGHVKFTVGARELGRAQETVAEEKPPIPVSRPRPVARVSVELNLIGLTVDQALPRLERYLHDAIYANMPEIRVIHGFGTGRLQQAVHEFLKGQSGVVSFRLGKGGEDPGGGGATLVMLKE